MSAEDESVAIFWDYENCEIPAVADSFLVTDGIRRIAHQYGNVKVFRAYLEVSDKDSSRSQALRSDLQACGVTLIDCPHNGRKDVADKMMMVDIVAHAIDNPPSTVMLITGDRDFVYAVSTMRNRKYRVVLLAPPAAHASLKSQATFVYEWPRSVLQAETPTPITMLRPRAATSSSVRPSMTQPLDRQTPSMIRIYSTPNTPQSGLSTLPVPAQQERPALAQHHRSASLPNANPDNLALDSGLGSPYTSTTNSYAAATAFSTTPPSDVRLSPAWRPGSRLAVDAPVFYPQSAIRSSAAEGASLDAVTAVNDREDGTDDASSAPSTPAATELSFDGGPVSPSDKTQAQHDRLSFSPSAAPLDDASLAPPLLEADAPPLKWVQVPVDVVVPTTVMVRLRKPPIKFKLLVRVLERERLAGNTRVNFSQLGSLLRAEHPAVYQRAGCAQLKDYVALAEEEAVVIVGKNFGEHAWDNGNKWVALHPVYHGRIPEPQPTGQYPPPPLMQSSQATHAQNY